MDRIRQIFRNLVDKQTRDSFYTLRTRGDTTILSGNLRGRLGWLYKPGTNQEHLQATMSWLCAAQDAQPGGGVSAFYDAHTGKWGPPYPETTGYIIPTFFDYAALSGNEEYRTRAIRMADWLLTLQLESGGFPIGPLWPDWEREPIVFDTGQALHGLVRVFQETHHQVYLDSARRAGDWLIKIQAQDGKWDRYVSLGYVHTYNVRSAWGLLRLYEACRDERYRCAACANLSWALSQQDSNGWFHNAGFRPEEYPLTHTIAYTIEGLLESGLQISEPRYVEAARLAADALRDKQAEDGFLRARYGPGWSSDLKWSCLTGTAQMAVIWLRLFQQGGDVQYLTAAQNANLYIKRRQSIHFGRKGVRGGVAGSYPIFEDYEPYRNLNWAAKFFIDGLMLEDRLVSAGAC